MNQNWQVLLEPILRQAGNVLLSYYNKPLDIHKKSANEIVTPADIASEKLLIHQLSELMPEAGIWSEEAGKKNENNPYCWVIDPLDGTTNFAHSLHYFGISVALTHHNIPVVSAIYIPVTDEFFYAEQGKGAFLNHEPIHVSEKKLQDAIIAVGLSYRHDQAITLINAGQKIMKNSYAIRHFGAIACDLAYIACGRLDGVFFTNLQWWDFAAGILLVKEAGGIVTNFNKELLKPTDKTAIIGGKTVHDELYSLLIPFSAPSNGDPD